MPDTITIYPNSSTYASTGYTTYVLNGEASFGEGGLISGSVQVKEGIHPILAFKYIKKKFGMLENIVLNRRLKKLEKAFSQAVENGQSALGDKILKEVVIESKQSAMYAKGIRHYIERKDINKVKNKIRDGHISDTKLKDYIKVIPKDVLKKKKDVEECFDGFVIYHYYNEKLEKKAAEKLKLTDTEKEKMRDPILFGYINELDRLYFVADWEDEYCDLTFDELIDIVATSSLTKEPQITSTTNQ